jgi:hypothetical protein
MPPRHHATTHRLQADVNWTMVQQTKPCKYPPHLYCIEQ